MDDFLDFFLPFFFGISGIVLVFFGLIVGADYLDCRGFRTATGIETQWEWGCYAKVNGRFVPKKYAFGDAQELRIKAAE